MDFEIVIKPTPVEEWLQKGYDIIGDTMWSINTLFIMLRNIYE